MRRSELDDANSTATKLFAMARRTDMSEDDANVLKFAAGMLAGQAARLWMAEGGGKMDAIKEQLREASIALWNKGHTEWVRINQPELWAELNPNGGKTPDEQRANAAKPPKK